MNTLMTSTPNAVDLWFKNDKLFLLLEDGRELGVPIDWFPKLRDATKIQLENWRLIGGGDGIHWEELDEDISIEGLLITQP